MQPGADVAGREHDPHRLRQRPLSAAGGGGRARRRPRLPVRRRRLRGVRGEEGALVEEARHLARLAAVARRTGHRAPDEPRGAGARHARDRRSRVLQRDLLSQVSRGTPRDLYRHRGRRPRLSCRGRRRGWRRRRYAASAFVSTPDIRWRRSHQDGRRCRRRAWPGAARQRRARGLVRRPDGFVTEGVEQCVDRHSEGVVSSAAGRRLGRPRATVIDAIRSCGLALEERPFSLAEALAAREAFVTSASNTVMPVVTVDGVPVGDGRPGPAATRLRSLFRHCAATSGR